MVILKADAVSRHSFLLGKQKLEGAKFEDKYYFRKKFFSEPAIAQANYASDMANGIDCFLMEENHGLSLWQAFPNVLREAIEKEPTSEGETVL